MLAFKSKNNKPIIKLGKNKEIKKLIWFLNYDLQYSGGGERLLFEGLNWFSKCGIEAFLYTNGNEIKPSALFNGSYNPNILKKEKSTGQRNRFFLIRHYLNIKESVEPIIRYNPDVIISNDITSLTLLWKAKLLGILSIPVFTFNHGSLFQFDDDISKYALIYRPSFKKIWSEDIVYRENISPFPPRLPLKVKLFNELLALITYFSVRYSRAVFVLTLKNKMEVEAMFRHKRVISIHGAFPRSLFNIELQKDKKKTLDCSGKTVIFSLCRLEKKKKIDVIVKAFALYLNYNANSILWIGGTGKYEVELRNLVKELNIENNVIFIGFVNDAELFDYYLSSDLFVSADNADYDITTFVALALGVKALVSSQHEFEPEIINHKLVYLSDPIPEDFAKELKSATITDSLVPRELSNTLLESYTWEHYFKNILNIMKSNC